jgi:hypothetical protein
MADIKPFKLRDISTVKAFTPAELESFRYNFWLLEQGFNAVGVTLTGSTGTPVSPPAGISDHHLLTNLTLYDDHPQYLYLNGRTPSQIVRGTTQFLFANGVPDKFLISRLNSPPVNQDTLEIVVTPGQVALQSTSTYTPNQTAFNIGGVGTYTFTAFSPNSPGWVNYTLQAIGHSVSRRLIAYFSPITVGGSPSGNAILISRQVLIGDTGKVIFSGSDTPNAAGILLYLNSEGVAGMADSSPSLVIAARATQLVSGRLLSFRGIAGTEVAYVDINGVFSGTVAPTGLTIKDNVFIIQDDVTPTKQLQFQLSGITAANTRTITIPDASGTIALIDLAQTWGALQTYRDDRFKLQASGDITKQATFDLSAILTGSTKVFKLPESGVTPNTLAVLGGNAQIFTSNLTFSNGFTASANSVINANLNINGLLYTDGNSGFGMESLVSSGGGQVWLYAFDGTGNDYSLLLPAFSGSISLILPTTGGTLVTTVASQSITNKVSTAANGSATAQNADKGTTNVTPTATLLSAFTQIYCLDVYILCSTADAVNNPVVKVTIGWTDQSGAKTLDCITGFNLNNIANYAYFSIPVRRSSGNFTYAVTKTGGTYGSGKYDIYMRVS